MNRPPNIRVALPRAVIVPTVFLPYPAQACSFLDRDGWWVCSRNRDISGPQRRGPHRERTQRYRHKCCAVIHSHRRAPSTAIKDLTDWVSLHPKEVICTLPPAGVTKSCSGFTTHDLILSSFGNLVAKVPRFRQGAAVSSSLDSGYALRAAAQWGACLVIGSE